MKEKPRSRLGRGLTSLMNVESTTIDVAHTTVESAHAISEEGLQTEPKVVEIAVDAVEPNPFQPRRDFDPVSLEALAASIRSSGLLQPITVCRGAHGYVLVAGERRLRAATLAGLTTIAAIVKTADDSRKAEWALIENIQREDLNSIDRATAYSRLMQLLNATQQELADRLGESRSGIANHLRLLQLPDDVQEHLRAGALSLGLAKVLAGIEDPARQSELASQCIEQGWNVRTLEKQIVPVLPASVCSPSDPRPKSAYVNGLGATISRQIGLRAEVRPAPKAGRGRVVIHYNTLDQFDELLRRLAVELAE